jgi:metallo-beta-lactamase class B
MTILRLCVCVAVALLQTREIPAEWTARVKPFHAIDNIYYVGTQDLASWLVTSPEGHVLVDSGLTQNVPTIVDGIRTLGFKVEDVKFLLTTQAHYDHVAAHAELEKLTGAQVVASAGDAALLESGGRRDYLFAGAGHFPSVTVDRRIKDGDVVRVGDVELVAHLTPGHTQGATTWSTTVSGPDGQRLAAVFVASTYVNPGTDLVANKIYPTIATDFANSLDRISKMKVDVFLAAHLSAMQGLQKMKRAGTTPNPFVDPAGFKTYVAGSRRAFNAELARQKAASR